MVLTSGENGSREISIYSRGEVTPTVLAQSVKKLQVAFPRMDMNFYNLLSERIIANGFTDQRLQDAIEKLIDNFQYKELNISDVISFDKRIKLYAYGEVSDLVSSNRAKMSDFEITEINERKFWIKLTDKQ